MTKERKKFRKAVQRSRTAKLLQTLALAGTVLCAPGQGLALELNNSSTWSISSLLSGLLVPETVSLTGGGAFSTVSTLGNYQLGNLGSLTITGKGSTGAATLNISSNILVTAGLLSNGQVTLSGAGPSSLGTLQISKNNTLTAGGLINVNNYGKLDVLGRLNAQGGLSINTGGQAILRDHSDMKFATNTAFILNGGKMEFRGTDGTSLDDGTINNDMQIKTGQVLAEKLSFDTSGSRIGLAGNGGLLEVTAKFLDLDGKTLDIGSAVSGITNVTLQGAKNSESIAEFLGGNIVIGGSAAVQTLNLGSAGNKGTNRSNYSILLAGTNGAQAAADKAMLAVQHGSFSVKNVDIGSNGGVASGTIVIDSGAVLQVTNNLNLHGTNGQVAVLKFGPSAGTANVLKAKNITVGGTNSYSLLDMTTNAGTVIVDTAAGGSLTLGSWGQMTVNNANSILEFTGDWTLDPSKLATSGGAAYGKMWLNNGSLVVGGTINTASAFSTTTGMNNLLAMDITTGALDTTAGMLSLNAGKSTFIHGINGGNILAGTLRVLGSSSTPDTLTLGQAGTSIATGSLSQGIIQLQGAAAGKALLVVQGNGAANSIYQLQSIMVGKNTTSAPATSTGTITVNGATLKVDTLRLLGMNFAAAELHVGTTTTADVVATSLTVGSATEQGNISLKNGSSLTAGTFGFHADNGSIFVDSNSKLNLNGSTSIEGADLTKGKALQAGSITLNSGASFNIAGGLTLSGASPMTIDITGAELHTKTIAVLNSALPTGLTWNGGKLVLYGADKVGSNVLNASQLNITNGIVQLGAADRAVGSSTLTTQSGAFTGSVTISGNGKLDVTKSNWHMNDTASGLIVSAASGLSVIEGYLGAVKLTTTGSGTVDVGTGPGIGRLGVTGKPNDLASTSGSINVYSNGVFETAYNTVVLNNDLKPGVGIFDVGLGGTLRLVGNGTITQAQYEALKIKLINGNGALQLLGFTITTPPSNRLMDVQGSSVPELVALVSNNDNITKSTTVKGLKGDPHASADIGLSLSTGELRLVGHTDQSSNFLFSDNGAYKTNFTILNGTLLTLGDAAGTTDTYGTLNGNVTLNEGGLNAVLGVFSAGAISGSGSVNVSNADLTLASLNMPALTGNITVNQAGTLLTQGDSSVLNLALDEGTFKTADGPISPTTGKDLTVNGALSLINNSLLHVGKDLTFTGTMGETKDSALEVLGSFDATDKNIIGSNLAITVGSSLNVAQLTANLASVYQLGSLAATGQTKVDTTSNLTVAGQLNSAGLIVDNGATVTARASANTAALSIGPNASASMAVTNNLDSTTVDIKNASTLTVGGYLNTSGASAIDQASTLTATGTLTTSGLIVDKGSVLTAQADATTGALSIGPNEKASMTVANNLDSTTVALKNASTLNVGGTMAATSAAVLENAGTILTVGGNLASAGLGVDKGAQVNANSGATISGNLAIGATEKSGMAVAQALTVSAATTLDHASTLAIATNFQSVGTTVDRGALLSVTGNAQSGVLSIGLNAMAGMTVGGNLIADSVSMNNGATLALTGIMTSAGVGLLEKGATLSAKALTLAGSSIASWVVGSTEAASIKTQTLNLGDATQQGQLTIANGSVLTNSLDNTTNGGILLQAAGLLNINGNLSLAAQNMVGSAIMQQGKIAFNGGSMSVAGNLGLTGTGPLAVNLAGGASGIIRTQTISAKDNGAATGFTWSGGGLALFGNGGNFADVSSLNVTSGKIRLGADDHTMGSTTLTTQGGTFAGPSNISGTGNLEIYKGAWTLGNVNVAAPATGGLQVSGGSVAMGTLAVSSSGVAMVNAGTATATQINLSNTASLVLTGGTVSTAGLSITDSAGLALGNSTSLATLNLIGAFGSLDSVGNSIDIFNNGYFSTAFATVASGTGLAGNVGKFDVATGGILALTGLDSITLANYQILRNNLINGSGLLELVGTTIINVPANTKLTDVLGTALPGTVVTAADGDTVNTSTTVKGVTIENPGTKDINLTVTDGELRMVGDTTNSNFSLADNGDKQTDFNIGQSASLALGNATDTVPTYGILKGDILLDGQLKADNGMFSVSDVTGQPNATGVTVNNSTLNTKALDLSQSPNSVVTVNNGALSASKDSTVDTVNLNQGNLITTGTADLTVNGPATLVNGSTLAAGGDLTFTGTTPSDPIVKATDSTVKAGGDINATGQNIVGDNMSLTAGGALLFDDLSATKSSHLNADSLQATGDLSLDKGASLVTAKEATVGGSLSLGPTAAAQMTVGGGLSTGLIKLNHGSVLGVTKDLASTGPVTLNNGSKATVGSKATINDLLTVENSSSLLADSLDAKKDMVVDRGALLTTAKDATIGGILSFSPTAAAKANVGGNLSANSANLNHNSQVTVAGNMATAASTSLSNGSQLSVAGSFTAGDKLAVFTGATLSAGSVVMTGKDIQVGSASGPGATLITGELNSNGGGKLLLAASSASFVGVDKLTNNQLSAMTVVAHGSTLSIGTSNKAFADARIVASGVMPASSLVLSSPITLAVKGQILVGEKYRTESGFAGVWDTNNTPDTYALALRGNSLLLADMSKVPAGGSLISLGKAAATSAVLVEESAAVRLSVDSGLKGDAKYTLVSGLGANSVFQKEKGTALLNGQTLKLNGPLATNNLLISIGGLVYNADTGTLDVNTVTNKATTSLPGLSGGMGKTFDNLAAIGFDVHHASAGVRFLSRATDTRYVRNQAEATLTVESAARIAAAGGVQGMTMTLTDAVRSTLENRTNGLSHLHGKGTGLSGGSDGNWTVDDGTLQSGVGLWFTPLYRSESVSNMKSDGFKTGYSGDLGGAALGADYTIVSDAHAVRVGASFNIGGGSAHSTGDFHHTNNNFNFWGANLYGLWNYRAFGLRGNVGYIANENSLKQNLPSGLGMEHLKANVDSNAFIAGLTAQYSFNTSMGNILPYAGVLYTRLNTSAHNTKSGDETVFHTAGEVQNIVSFPIGLGFEKAWTTESGWLVKPSLDLGVIAATGDLDTKHKIGVTGVGGLANLNTQVVDSLSFAGGLGLHIKKDSMSLALDYNLLASKNRTSNGLSLTFRMAF